MDVRNYWVLEEAQKLVQAMQPNVRKFGYHICLGGGVLNNGMSKKDLDLFFLALDNGTKANSSKLIEWLVGLWGDCEGLGERYKQHDESPYTGKVKFNYCGLRIDVFIVGGEKVTIEGRPKDMRGAPDFVGLNPEGYIIPRGEIFARIPARFDPLYELPAGINVAPGLHGGIQGAGGDITFHNVPVVADPTMPPNQIRLEGGAHYGALALDNLLRTADRVQARLLTDNWPEYEEMARLRRNGGEI